MRAAATLGVDATTVGRRVRRLERTLGQQLFEQTRDGQVLNRAGERLFAKAVEIERSASEIQAGTTGTGPAQGLVRVSASEGFGSWFIAHHVKSFLSANPEVELDLTASSGFLS